MSLTGANADHHRLVRPDEFHDILAWLAAEFGAPLPRPALPEARGSCGRRGRPAGAARRGPGAGRRGPGARAARVGALDECAAGAPVEAIAPVWPPPHDGPARSETLVAAMRAGQADTLLILGANPAYDAPADLGFAEALRQVPFALHHGMHADETAALCAWHLPAPHPLEDWGDLRSRDGTAAIVQPLIRPLYSTHAVHDVVAMLRLLSRHVTLLAVTQRDTVAGCHVMSRLSRCLSVSLHGRLPQPLGAVLLNGADQALLLRAGDVSTEGLPARVGALLLRLAGCCVIAPYSCRT